MIMMKDYHQHHDINGIRCDGTEQCPLGDDEEECRFLLSETFIVLFFLLVIITFITFLSDPGVPGPIFGSGCPSLMLCRLK